MKWPPNSKDKTGQESAVRNRRFHMRRWILLLSAVLFLWIAGSTLHAVFIEPDMLMTVRETIAVPGLPETFDGFRIAVLSDFHLTSGKKDRALLRRAIDRTNELSPDAVFLLGDFVEGNIPGYRGEIGTMTEELARLRPRDGIFAVLGNHDRKIGIGKLVPALEHAGVHVLENSACPVRRGDAVLFVAGLAERNPDYRLNFLPATASASPLFLLSHYPDRTLQVERPADLSFAGHTHGGQIAFPVTGAPLVYSKHGLLRGLEKRRGRRIFITSGIGTSLLRIRNRVPPEVVLVTLRAESL